MLTLPLIVALTMGPAVLDTGRGVVITPDAAGRFEYVDDYKTNKFLADACTPTPGPDGWRSGALINTGPNSWSLVYRFYGDRAIEGIDVHVAQTANGPALGAANSLALSTNGLDWIEVANSGQQQAGNGGWQREPLTLPAALAPKFVGKTAIWLRISLANHCGLKTNVSNTIESLRVVLHVGDALVPETDAATQLNPLWDKWQAAKISASFGTAAAPHKVACYVEDLEGRLTPAPQAADQLLTISKAYSEPRRPLALALFVDVQKPAPVLLARVVVRATQNSSRKMEVLWDGVCVGVFDAARYFEGDQAFVVRLPSSAARGRHELRIACGDLGTVAIREVSLAGEGVVAWTAKPGLPAGGSLEVLDARYLPDPPPPADSHTVEGRNTTPAPFGVVCAGLQRLYKEHADFGGMRVVLRNNGQTPVDLGDELFLNGRPIEDSYVDFAKSAWDARGTIWYRIRPKLVSPGECAQIYVRFRRRPAGQEAKLALHPQNAPAIALSVPYADPGVAVDYVVVSRDGKTLYVYARRDAEAVGPMTAATLDGALLPNAKIYGPDFPGGIALTVAKLSQPLSRGSFHVAGVRTATGQTAAAQFRVLPFFFPRSSYHVPPTICAEMHMNLTMWRQTPLADCEKYNVYTTSGDASHIHRRALFAIGLDEPDARDNLGGGYDKGLGLNARRFTDFGWQEYVQRFAPWASTWIVMDGTTRPLNWCVYGQYADVTCFDPYPVTNYGADHAFVRESLSYARRCGAPKPMYACVEAFGWTSGQGTPPKIRGPLPAEYRQNVVQALGSGAKGLTNWVYAVNAGGWQNNALAKAAIADMNALITHLEDDLLLGTPINLAHNDAGAVATGIAGEERWSKQRVWTSSLLCGPDAIVVAAANHIPAACPSLPVITPAKNVTITVALPEYLQNVTAYEATERGLQACACALADGKATLKLDSLESGRIFVLRRK